MKRCITIPEAKGIACGWRAKAERKRHTKRWKKSASAVDLSEAATLEFCASILEIYIDSATQERREFAVIARTEVSEWQLIATGSQEQCVQVMCPGSSYVEFMPIHRGEVESTLMRLNHTEKGG